MKKRNFTLTELLTVIAIIAILASLGGGGYMMARKKAREMEAQTDCNSIKMALQQYQRDFSTLRKLAGCTEVTEKTDGAGLVWYTFTTDNEAAMKVLTGNPDAADKSRNPRKIKYLESRTQGTDTWKWLDPWDQPYVVLFAAPGKDKVQDPFDDTKVLNGDIFVYSKGTDVTEATNDDVTSW